jgi:secondary thiamine-phosphate synthase enzyme
MRQAFGEIATRTSGPGLYEVTGDVSAWTASQGIGDGLLTIFLRHTSASLLIQENADPDVRADLEDFFSNLVVRGPANYRHRAEGPDDMPAHIRAALTQTQLSVPIEAGRPALGTWQGIYLFEHRDRPHERRLKLHLIGE